MTKANQAIELASRALTEKPEKEIGDLEESVLQKARLGFDVDKFLAREEVGEALLSHSIGMALVANLKMRDRLETASDILHEEVLSRPVPEAEEPALATLNLKIKAAQGAATLAERHMKLTTELLQLVEVKGHVRGKVKGHKLAPQTFTGTNYVQINHNEPPRVPVASAEIPSEDTHG